jgi:ABC-2 type transport system ATP-binding protein
MKIVTGQLRPSTGTVQVFGEPIWAHPEQYRRLGFCPEQDAFYEHMTGADWLAALASFHGMDETTATASARRALDTVGLTDVADRKIGSYSKGMRQRIKLAQAILHDPQLLILDEPLSGMDPIMRRRTIQLIKQWARDGKSVVVSSHILHEIQAMTSNVLLIHNGRVIAEGNIHQIREVIDEHPHRVSIRAQDPHAVARHLLGGPEVSSVRFEDGIVIVETPTPDAFYARLTEIAASGDAGAIEEITSPDDSLQAIFSYLVKQ